MMTDNDEITLYSCHLCGFCETSLAALTKHTASHIKTEKSKEKSRPSQNGRFEIIQKNGTVMTSGADAMSGGQNESDAVPRVMVSSNGSDIIVVSGNPRDARHVHHDNSRVERASHREYSGGFSISERDEMHEDDEEVIVIQEGLKSPQVGDVFPSNSSPVTPHSRVIFPSGWGEPPQRTSGIRMPNERFRNVQQTETAYLSESRDRNMPKIINCTTVRPKPPKRGYLVANGIAYPAKETYDNSMHPEHTEYATQAYEMEADPATELTYHREQHNTSRPNGQHQNRPHRSFSGPRDSPVIQDVFSRPSACRPREMHGRNRGSRPAVHLEPVASHNSSAFVPFGGQSSQPARHHYPSYQDLRSNRPSPQTVQSSHHQSNMTQQGQSDPNSRHNMHTGSRFSCPMPIPNHGTIVMNPNQPVMLPPYGSYDGVSGILVVPLKKTTEIGIQTDESCMSPDYMPYQPPQNQALADSQANPQSSAENNLKCTVCQKEFPNVQKLRLHFEAAHTKESLRCKDCGQVFLTAKNMQMHKIRVHNKRMPFRCGVCSLRFEDRTSVVQHLATHNANENIFRCDTCGKRFGTEEKLRKHEQKHKDMWHKCIECNRSFGSEVTLAYHVEQVHRRQHQYGGKTSSKEATGDQIAQEQAANNQVEEIDDVIYDDNEVENGPEAVAPPEELSCQFCSSKFLSSKKLENHVRNCELSSFGKGMKKMFRCAVCHTFFALKSQLVNHYNTMHLSRDGYMCSKCPRKFRLWSRLKLHIKTFHQTRRSAATKNACTVCPEKFLSRNKLEEHLRDVHQIQPFQSKVGRIYTCKECKKRFTNLSSLMVHRRGVHSLNILESPSTQTWKCQFCNIERLTKKTYIAHLKEVHDVSVIEKGRSLEIIDKDSVITVAPNGEISGSKERELKSSKKRFSDVSDDRLEVNEVNGTEETWSCNECAADYPDEKSLKNHLGLVHGRKPFVCTTCGKRFAYSGQIAWHNQQHEAENLSSDRHDLPSTVDTRSSSIGSNNEEVITAEADESFASSVETVLPPHTCIHCNTTYQNEKRLNNHLGMRHGYKNFQCDVCSQKFAYSTHLIWHRRSHFPDKKKESAARIQDSENFQMAGDESNVDDENIHEDNIDDIDVENSLEENRTDSSSLHRGDVANGYRQRSRFVCTDCNADFSEEGEFRKHMAVAHNVSKEKRFGSESSFTEIDANAGEMPGVECYVCEVCNKQLSTHIGWKVHRSRVHKLTDDKPIMQPPNTLEPMSNSTPTLTIEGQNDVAGSTAQNSKSPKNNVLGSEDLNPSATYSCSKCSRVFTGLRSLRTHQFKLHAIRVKDRRHRSPLVYSRGPSFTTGAPKAQTAHIFQCGTCDYQFSTEKGRRIHCKKMRHAEHRQPLMSSNQSPSFSSDRETTEETSITVEMGKPNESSSAAKRQRFDDDTEDAMAPCELCRLEFPNLAALKLHFQEKHPEKIAFQEQPFSPPATFPDAVPGLSPQLQPLMINCPRCDRSFASRKAITSHLFKFHKLKGVALAKTLREATTSDQGRESADRSLSEVAKSGDFIASPEEYPPGNEWKDPQAVKICPVCQRAFANQRGLTMHLVRHHNMDKYGIQRLNLGLHYDDGVPISPNEIGSGKDVKSISLKEYCPLCPKRFPNRRSLGTHIFKRHGIRCKQLSPAERRSLFSAGKYQQPDAVEQPNTQKALISTIAMDCPICCGKFVGKRGLRAHVSRIHGLDKIELGFIFPEKGVTDDETLVKCSECSHEFNNRRIFAAHLYFVHKKDKVDAYVSNVESITKEIVTREQENVAAKDEGDVNGGSVDRIETEMKENDDGALGDEKMESLQGTEEKVGELIMGNESSASAQIVKDSDEECFRCNDADCGKTFSTPLELLVHVREKNGRSLVDVDKELKNSADVVGEHDDSFEYADEEVNEEVHVEDESMENELIDDGDIDDDSLDDDENLPDVLVEQDSGKVVCFVCKSEYDNQKAFKIHYRKAHGKKSHEDSEKLREEMERSLLQTEAVSKEYSLRATASRKAFRSEIELTEQILSKPSSPEVPDIEEGTTNEEVFYPENVTGEELESTSSPIHQAEENNSSVEVTESTKEHCLSPSSDSKETNSEVVEPQGADDQQNEEPAKIVPEAKEGEDEPAKKSAFAAALNLQVMS